jgi:NADH dehydrogenase (ubiquinone) Fe-S protein 6
MLSRRLLTVAARFSARRSAPVAVRFASTEAQIAEVKKQSNLKEGEPQIEGHVASESKYEQVSVWQEPNRATTWSRSQKPRGQALTGPRFEQTEIDAQVCSTYTRGRIAWPLKAGSALG